MNAVIFPGPDFPPPARVGLTLLPQWRPVHIPNTWLATERDVADGEFVTNILVRYQRVSAGLSLPEAAAVVDRGVAELTGVEDIVRGSVESDGREGYAREFAFRDPRAGTLAQAWRVFLVPNGPVADLIELVGTWSAARTADVTEIRQILASVTLTVGAMVPSG